jgi:hypothetical protein
MQKYGFKRQGTRKNKAQCPRSKVQDVEIIKRKNQGPQDTKARHKKTGYHNNGTQIFL